MYHLKGRLARYCIFSIVFSSAFIVSFLWYYCTNDVCSLQKFSLYPNIGSVSKPYWRKLKANRDILKNWTLQESVASKIEELFSNNEDDDKSVILKSDFDIDASDVIVFLHIQNTGGSVFARHMVEDLNLERPCRCKKNRRICRCYRPSNFGSTWFFSRYTTGWKCGVHPDWSQLSNCVDRVMDEDEGKPVKRRYFFMTVLRDPVKRFLSEFWHIRQGQSWSSSRHWCNGVEATQDQLPACFEDRDLGSLSLEEFADCEHNLGINRQARMIADLALVGCYNSSSLSKEDRDLIILTSAKNNLHKMSFFGLSEFPKVSQYMFEVTFGLSFRFRNSVAPSHESSINRSARKELFNQISAKDVERIKRINYLDIELYHYAKQLLFYRFEKLKKSDPLFKNNFEVLDKNKMSNEDWADREDFVDNLLE